MKQESEREGGDFLRTIALSTAFLAALAAIAALRAGATVNEAIVLKTEATRLRAEASDRWACDQSKGVKAAVQEASRAAWLAAGKEPPAEHAAAAALLQVSIALGTLAALTRNRHLWLGSLVLGLV